MNVRWTVGTAADGATEVVVYGDVDLSVEDALHAALHECITAEAEHGRTVRVDLADVAFMDSAGLRSLMRLRLEHGDAVIISRVSGPVARLFEVAGVTEWLLPARNGDVQSAPGP